MSLTPLSQTSSGIVGCPFVVGQGHKNGVAFDPNTSLWSGLTPPTWCATSYQSGFGSPVAAPSVFIPGNHKGDSFASNHLATPTWKSSGTSSRPSYTPTTFVGPVSTSGGYRTTSNVEKLVSISAMPAYNTKSHEELRLEDYMTGKRGSGTNSSEVKSYKIPFPKITSPSVITPCARDPIYPENGFNPFAPRTSLTCPASTVTPVSFKPGCYNLFAKPFTSTWASIGTSSGPSYRPTNVGPVSTSGGYRATSNVEKLVSISAMPAYNTKSHEELRLEDYINGKRGSGTNSSEGKSYKMPFPKITSPSVIIPCARDPIYPDNNTNPFGPKASLTSPASTVSPVSFKPWCYNPFANPSTSPPKQPSSSSFSIPTISFYPKDSKITPVSSEPISFISKPITLVSPCVPSTQKCDEEVTRIIGQSSASQLSSSHITSTSSLANPFGTLPPSPQSFSEHSRSTPIQYGISSIPVKDKPAPVRYPLHTTRHISRVKLPVRKYNPKSSVPFFLSEL